MLSSTLNTDKRLWLLGLGLGNFAGLLLLLSGNPVSRRFLETAFPYTASGYYTGDFLLALGLCLGGLVFPAILTRLARRFYALWGLLPLFLWTLWIIAGRAVSHTLPAGFELFLSSLLVILLCWTISCAPISLFRVARKKYSSRPSVAPVFGPPRRPRRLLPALLLLPSLALAGLGAYNWKHPKTGQFTVTARFASGEAHVPLVVKHGGVFVVASLNGTQTLCKIDTGSDTVQWHRNLHCAGVLTGERGQTSDPQKGSADAEVVILPHIQIGTFTLTGLPTMMQDTYTGLFSPTQERDGDTTPLLGNPLFALTVLTIDYRHRVLTIRPPTHNFQTEPRHYGDRILQLGWTSHSEDSEGEQQLFGWPTFRARVEGKPFWCVFDSGWEGPELGITETLLQSFPMQRQAPRTPVPQNFQHGSYTVPQLKGLQFQAPVIAPAHAPPLCLQSKTIIVKSLGGGDGIVGTYLMERYRITLDYQRRCILLEPYARPVATQKQEKAGVGAKQ